MYQHIKVPEGGQKITVNADFSLNVPDQPIIPYIEGDGTGFDITPVMIKVVDAAVAKAYGGNRQIQWMEVYAGEKANNLTGSWLPDETLDACREFLVAIAVHAEMHLLADLHVAHVVGRHERLEHRGEGATAATVRGQCCARALGAGNFRDIGSSDTLVLADGRLVVTIGLVVAF